MYTGRPPLSQNARTKCGASARDAARVCVCVSVFTCAVCLRAPVARILERQLHVVVAVVVATRSSHIVPSPSLFLSLTRRFEINRRRFRVYAKAPLSPPLPPDGEACVKKTNGVLVEIYVATAESGGTRRAITVVLVEKTAGLLGSLTGRRSSGL